MDIELYYQEKGNGEPFIKQKELKKAIILGFSDGANIAMKFAMKYPEEFNKAVDGFLTKRGNVI